MNNQSKIKKYVPELSSFRDTLRLHPKDNSSHILQLFDTKVNMALLSIHVKQFQKDAHAQHRLQIKIGKYKKLLKYCKQHYQTSVQQIISYFK